MTATTLRNIIGEMELDHTSASRDVNSGPGWLTRPADARGIGVSTAERHCTSESPDLR